MEAITRNHEPNKQSGHCQTAYLCARFPKLSEVFILRELIEHQREGLKPLIFSLLPSAPGESVHPDVARLNPRVAQAPRIFSARLLWSHVREFVHSPARYLGTAGQLILPLLRAPRELPEAAYLFLVAGGWAKQVREEGITHLHAHFAGAATTTAWLLSRLTGTRFGFTAHANDIFVRPFALCEKLAAASYVVTVSQYNRTHLAALCPAAASRIEVLPAGIDPEEGAFRSVVPEGEPPLILSVGRLVEKKGFHVLIAALAKLSKAGRPFRCVIAGGGPLHFSLARQIDELGLNGQITLSGEKTTREVADLLSQATVFALPCVIAADGDRDGLPHSIMEAMAAGVPVVSTRLAGIPELIRDGEDGLLAEPGDADSLATCLETVLANPHRQRALATRARVRVSEYCDIGRIAARLRSLFDAAVGKGIMAFGLVLSVTLVNTGQAAEELFPDPELKTPTKYLRPYSNFGKSDPIFQWKAEMDAGQVVITAGERQPQARVGIRSLPVPLGPGDYLATIRAKATGVHRSGFYAILVDKDDKLLAQSEIYGPGGDFTRDFELPITIQSAHSAQMPGLILYAFTDGAGTLEVQGMSIQPITGATRGVAASRKISPIFHQMTLGESLYEPPFQPLTGGLLTGESRYHLLGKGAEPRRTFAVTDRNVAVAWQMGVAAPVPFWLDPTDKPADDALRVGLYDGPTSGGVVLPPLPPERGAYLFYYGAFRYGKKPKDLTKDRQSLALIREAGFTGIGFWDDYGLDYQRFLDGKPLDGSYLVAMAELYKQSGYTSPMFYSMFGGLDRGRVAWTSGDEVEMIRFLTELKPWVEKAKAALGETPLWICPADEPDDRDRQVLAVKLAHIWNQTIPTPMFATSNWQTGQRLGNQAKILLGAGDFPSFEAASKSGIAGYYCSVDAAGDPIRFRYLAGVHSWASGIPNQAYWHFESVAGKLDSDLDGHMADFLCRDTKGGRDTVIFSQLQEGLMDLRMLLALDALRAAPDNSKPKEVKAFLDRIRSEVLPTDRLAAPWDQPARYTELVTTGRDLLVRYSAAGQPMESNHPQKGMN